MQFFLLDTKTKSQLYSEPSHQIMLGNAVKNNSKQGHLLAWSPKYSKEITQMTKGCIPQMTMNKWTDYCLICLKCYNGPKIRFFLQVENIQYYSMQHRA